jgi:hypothetical protein
MINWKELKGKVVSGAWYWELRRPTENRSEWAAKLSSSFIIPFHASGLS